MTDSPSPTEPDAIPAPPAPNRRRRLWLFAGIVGLLFATVFAVIVYSDAPEPDLSDLTFEPIPVPDDENLYVVLTKISERLAAAPILKDDEPTPPSVVLTNRRTWRENLLRGEAWTPEILARCGPAWEALADEVAAALVRYPIMQGALSTPAPKVRLRELTQNLRLAARAHQYADHPQDAARTALSGYEIGLRLADSRGSQLDYIIGLGAQRDFIALLHELAAQPDANSATLNLIADGLQTRRRHGDAYAHTLRNELHMTAAMLRDVTLARTESSSRSSFATDIGPVAWIARTRVLFPLVYKPNLTVELHADFIRNHLAWLDTPGNLRREMTPAKFDGGIEFSDLHQPYNLLGRYLAEAYQVQLLTTRSRDNTFARRRLLEFYVALRRFHHARSELPASLNDLLPVYLDAVPADPADGAPLRYSRDYRVIWSTLEGFDIRNANKPILEGDPVLRLEFTAPITPPPAAPPAADGSPPRAASASP